MVESGTKISYVHGEDEYRCLPQGTSPSNYRGRKKIELRKFGLGDHPLQKHHSIDFTSKNSSLLLISNTSNFTMKSESVDHITQVYEQRNSTVRSVYNIVRNSQPNGIITFEKHYLPFVCNRGLAVKYYTGHTICFCPPSFYGSQCQFYSDRITIVTHLDLTNYNLSSHQIVVIKILTTFLFQEEIIDYYEFYVHPQIQTKTNYLKQNIYFVYMRSQEFLKMKKINRNGTQLYNVRFEAFNLYINETIEPIGVWYYPIYFDFLPSFRLSKILRFNPSSLDNPCSNHSCGKNGTCQEVINSNQSLYFCSCNSGYYGIRCEHYDDNCNNYCSPKSICKPKYGGMIRGNQQPLCLCSTSTFGNKCYLKNDHCQNNPCLHGGTCIIVYDLTNIDRYMCICTDSFIGDHCQFVEEIINNTFVLLYNLTLQTNDVVATIVSYMDFYFGTSDFFVRHQQLFRVLPAYFTFTYSHKYYEFAPTVTILKVYRSNYYNEEPEYYVLYLSWNEKQINTIINLTPDHHCPFVETLWYLIQRTERSDYLSNSTFNSTTAVFFYHRICQSQQNTNISFTCFRDVHYLCICEPDYYRAECFTYDRSIDQCSSCLSNGYCLKGELTDSTDFLCLCPHCHYGKMCEFSNELMGFTLDSLTIKDLQTNPKLLTSIYISITIVIFLFGLFNNLSSFLTFIRPKSRKFGIGNYLLIVSIVNQCSLLFLLLKFLHIILGSNGNLFHYKNINLYSCKMISYFLSIFTRITNWLGSLVTIERLFMVLFPTSVVFKKSRHVFIIIIFVILMVSGMHVHEAMNYITIVDSSYTTSNTTLCVTNYTQQLVVVYNRINVLIHYFIPFGIQFISITILIFQTARSRARVNRNTQETLINLFKKQFKIHKEHYITPIIIFLSSLPQTILSFSYICTELKQSWQKYILLTTYFLSYLPQMLGFILYVLPSTIYTEEFQQTVIGKRLIRQQQKQVVEMKRIAK